MKRDFKIIRTRLTIKYRECVFGGYRDFNGIVKIISGTSRAKQTHFRCISTQYISTL